MTRPLALVPIVILMLATGCGDSHQSLASEGMATMKELVATLDTVKDEASAKAAKPKLKTLAEKMDDIGKRQNKLGTPTEAEFKDIDKKLGKEMEELQQKMVGHMMRIAFDPKIQSVLADINMKH